MATPTCKKRSVILDMDHAPPCCLDFYETSEWILEQSDNAGRAFGVAGELLEQFEPGQARRQRLGVQVGRDQNEGVVMRRLVRWCAGAEISRCLVRADAANKFFGGLA